MKGFKDFLYDDVLKAFPLITNSLLTSDRKNQYVSKTSLCIDFSSTYAILFSKVYCQKQNESRFYYKQECLLYL